MKNSTRALRSFIENFGIESSDSEELKLQKNTYVYATFFGVLGLISWSIPMFYYGEKWAGILWLAYAAFLLSTLVYWSFHKARFILAGYLFILSLMLFPFCLSLAIGTYTGFGGSWYLILAIIASYIYANKHFHYFLGIAMVVLISALVIESRTTPSPLFPQTFFTCLYGGSILFLGGITVVMLITLFKQRNLAFSNLKVEQLKSENLLLNILPKEISMRLKANTEVIADQLEQASVLFADIVQFTELSARMRPNELLGLLNEIFSHFDDLVDKYDLEKIKTIGDCYMVASGVPVPRSDHATALLDLAIDMQEFILNYNYHNKKLFVRIGIHSGELIAGVIGKKKFAYDLWGDTVNTASRMESHGIVNGIQITRATYELVKHRFECVSLGNIQVKGKGEIEAWQVVGRVSGLS